MTIEDVAAVAGLSRGTVSRVLNGAHSVSPQALLAVQSAMAQIGYVANHSARTLVTRRSGAVAFVLSENHERLFEDPNFSVLISESTTALEEQNMTLFLTLNVNAGTAQRILSYAQGGFVDGILLVSPHRHDSLFAKLRTADIPTVVSGPPMGAGSSLSYVGAEDRDGARLMTRHLVDRGYRKIGMISGPWDTSGARERVGGFQDVLGRRATARLIIEAPTYGREAGRVAMAALLDRTPDIDAVFVASDLMAAGAIQAVVGMGLRVPQDIAIGGFDDSAVALTTDPPLTTMRLPFADMARIMVWTLTRMIEGQPAESVRVPTQLIVRNST